MTTRLSTYAQDMILNGRISDELWPFYEESGTTYMRYDTIRMENKSDEILLITYRYKGRDIYYMEQDGVSFKRDNTITLEGIEGRMEIRITP